MFEVLIDFSSTLSFPYLRKAASICHKKLRKEEAMNPRNSHQKTKGDMDQNLGPGYSPGAFLLNCALSPVM